MTHVTPKKIFFRPFIGDKKTLEENSKFLRKGGEKNKHKKTAEETQKTQKKTKNKWKIKTKN